MTVVRFMNNRISSQIGRGERRLSIAPDLGSQRGSTGKKGT